MKLEIDLEKFKSAIFKAEKITGKNLTLQILNSILFIASGKSLKLRATNLSLGVDIEIPAKIEREGIAAVPGSFLLNIFSNIQKNDNKSILLEEVNGNLLITTKNNKIKLKSYSHVDFPSIPIVAGESFKIEAKKIIDGIKMVYYSASISDIKPEYSSVYIYNNENNLIFVSTDSFRLAEKKIKIKNNLENIENLENLGILIPFKNITEILRVFDDVAGEIDVNFTKNQISFYSSNIYLTSRLIDGIFPDYTKIIPKDFTTEIIILKQDLLNALKISDIFSDKFHQINILVKPKEKILKLSNQNINIGDNETYLDAALSGEDIEFAFNCKYFFDCLQSISTDSISIKLNQFIDPNTNQYITKPIVISGVSDPSFTYLIMPMNK